MSKKLKKDSNTLLNENFMKLSKEKQDIVRRLIQTLHENKTEPEVITIVDEDNADEVKVVTFTTIQRPHDNLKTFEKEFTQNLCDIQNKMKVNQDKRKDAEKSNSQSSEKSLGRNPSTVQPEKEPKSSNVLVEKQERVNTRANKKKDTEKESETELVKDVSKVLQEIQLDEDENEDNCEEEEAEESTKNDEEDNSDEELEENQEEEDEEEEEEDSDTIVKPKKIKKRKGMASDRENNSFKKVLTRIKKLKTPKELGEYLKRRICNLEFGEGKMSFEFTKVMKQINSYQNITEKDVIETWNSMQSFINYHQVSHYYQKVMKGTLYLKFMGKQSKFTEKTVKVQGNAIQTIHTPKNQELFLEIIFKVSKNSWNIQELSECILCALFYDVVSVDQCDTILPYYLEKVSEMDEETGRMVKYCGINMKNLIFILDSTTKDTNNGWNLNQFWKEYKAEMTSDSQNEKDTGSNGEVELDVVSE